MRRFFLDASALGKRYLHETGSHALHRLFASVSPGRFVCLTLTVGEVIWVINRKCNSGVIAEDDALDLLAALDREVLHDARFGKVPMPDSLVVPSFTYIRRHNLNTSDAIALNAAIEIQQGLPRSETLVMVASDDRMLRAARAEGLETFDPEHDSQQRLDELCAAPGDGGVAR